MENILGQIINLIRDVKRDQDVIKEQTIRNTANLEVHMRRTEQNEELIKFQEARLRTLEDKEKLLSNLWKISIALAGFVATILGIIVSIHQLR